MRWHQTEVRQKKMSDDLESVKNQMMIGQAEAAEELIVLRNKNEKLNRDLVTLQETLKIEKLTEENTKLKQSLDTQSTKSDQSFTSLSSKLANLQETLTASDWKNQQPIYDQELSELRQKVEKLEFNEGVRDDLGIYALRKIHEAYDEFPTIRKTNEDIKKIIITARMDKHCSFMQTIRALQAIRHTVEYSKSNTSPCFHIFQTADSIIQKVQNSATEEVSLDYFKLLLALVEISKNYDYFII
jgi:hypothetical protein